MLFFVGSSGNSSPRLFLRTLHIFPDLRGTMSKHIGRLSTSVTGTDSRNGRRACRRFYTSFPCNSIRSRRMVSSSYAPLADGQPSLGGFNHESKKALSAESAWWGGHLARHSNRQAGSLSHQIIFFSAVCAMEPYSTPDLVILSQWRPFVLKSPNKMRLRLQEHPQKLDINNKLSHGSAIR